MNFWHDLITKKSWEILTQINREHKFVLIGGWAVFLYAKTLKSKDIDVVFDYNEFGAFQKNYPLTKNERLKKYEARLEEIEIDIYVPHYSNPGIPAEKILLHTTAWEGFRVPKPEILLLLKQNAFRQRGGTTKGEKDKLDIVSLLRATNMDWSFYKNIADKERPTSLSELIALIESLREVPELEIKVHQMSRLKKEWKKKLSQ